LSHVRNQERRTRRAPRFEIGMGARRVLKAIALPDGHLDLAVADHLEHARRARGALARIELIVEQRRPGDDLRPVPRENAKIDAPPGPAGIAVADDQAPPRGSLE